MDGGEARAELWRRYDTGQIGADELEARLQLLDRAPLADAEAIRRAVDGPVPVRRRSSLRKRGPAVVAALGVVAVAVGVFAIAAGSDDGGRNPGEGFAVTTFVPLPAPLPAPGPALEDCDEFEAVLEANGGEFGNPELPANPAPLSDPAYVPAGYELTFEEEIMPGTDGDLAMSTAAGDPLPIAILARGLGGELPVRMRAFVFESVEVAAENSRNLARTGLCSFDAEPFTVPDRPELFGTVVTGVIPTTAFVSFTLGDRRVIVAAEAADGPVEAAQQLAGEIAGAEYDAARTAPPLG